MLCVCYAFCLLVGSEIYPFEPTTRILSSQANDEDYRCVGRGSSGMAFWALWRGILLLLLSVCAFWEIAAMQKTI